MDVNVLRTCPGPEDCPAGEVMLGMPLCFWNSPNLKRPRNSPANFAVFTLKFEQSGFTIE